MEPVEQPISNEAQPNSSTEPSKSSEPVEKVNKMDKMSVVVMAVMFLFFIIASGFAVYFYVNDSNCPSTTEQCLGMVSTSECQNYVDCPTNEVNIDEDSNDDTLNEEVKVESFYSLKYPTRRYEQNGKYYFDLDYCLEWDEAPEVVTDFPNSECLKEEARTYELSSEGYFLVASCDPTDQANEGGLSHHIWDAETIVNDMTDEEFEAGNCYAVGGYGMHYRVVNDNLIVDFTNTSF